MNPSRRWEKFLEKTTLPSNMLSIHLRNSLKQTRLLKKKLLTLKILSLLRNKIFPQASCEFNRERVGITFIHRGLVENYFFYPKSNWESYFALFCQKKHFSTISTSPTINTKIYIIFFYKEKYSFLKKYNNRKKENQFTKYTLNFRRKENQL